MNFEDMLAKAMANNKPRKKPSEEEHQLQCACVKAFRYQFPKYALSLFAVPNGGQRNAVVAAKLKAEGVLAGVSDLLFLEACGPFHGLAIELKTPKGVQSKAQKEWQEYIESRGWKYVVIRSVDEFMMEVKGYLKLSIEH